MKNTSITHIIMALFAAVVVSFSSPGAYADPAPQVYVPVRTVSQANQIKPGDRVALICGHCGMMKTFVAGKDMGFLQRTVCTNCKHEFVRVPTGHGGSRDQFILRDSEGEKAQLLKAQ